MKEEIVNKYLEQFVETLGFRESLENNYSPLSTHFKNMYLVNMYVDEILSLYDENDINDYNPKDFEKMYIFDKLYLVKKFFSTINYKVNVDEKINTGELNPINFEFDMSDKNKWKKYLNANGGLHGQHRNIYFSNADLVLDIIIMIHELGHSVNKTNDSREKQILSEAFAIYTELNADEFLEERNYKLESKFMKEFRFNYIKKIASENICAMQLYDVFVKYGKVTKEYYEKEYDGDYERTLNSISNYETFFRMDQKLEYIFGTFLACYMFNKFREDYSFSENINIANKNMENINENCLEEILRILSIDKLDKYTIDMMKGSFQLYVKNYLNNNKKTNSLMN